MNFEDSTVTHRSAIGIDAIEDKIAVVGMSCRFPGAKDVDTFWDNLVNGRCAAVRLDEDGLTSSNVPSSLTSNPNYVPVTYPIGDFDGFDADFWCMSKSEARTLDPQHRVFLEQAHAALEDACLPVGSYEERTGVYAGSSISSYMLFNLLQGHDWGRPSQSLNYLLSNDKDYVASRVAYKLDLGGPALSVQTACSSSLVAVCQAVTGLLNYECDVALAGGVSVRFPHLSGYIYEPGGVFSPDGLCRSFDAAGSGTVFGSGAGVVVLKRLADALEDGDLVYAVVSGAAVTNDGARKAGFAAPNVDGQYRAIAAAIGLSGVDPATIGMLEMHGTGTQIGDPIEVAAAAKAFSAAFGTSQYCAIGSVKSNIGHLDAAAGIASFIKAVKSVEEGYIPKTLHFEQENPNLQLGKTPFRVARETSVWDAVGAARIAGVSSFGMGGTNAHVIIEQWQEASKSSSAKREPTILALSAASEASLRGLVRAYRDYFSMADAASPRSVALTAGICRKPLRHRKAFLLSESNAVIDQMDGWLNSEGAAKIASPGKIAFVYSGQGSGSTAMGQPWMRSSVTYRDFVKMADGLVVEGGEAPFLVKLMQDGKANYSWQTPVQIFVHQCALDAVWKSFGVRPDIVLGHSLGEIAAAVSSGILSFPDALEFTIVRSQLMERGTAAGAMLSVRCDEAQLREIMNGEPVEVAAINAPNLFTLAGTMDAIVKVEATCVGAGVGTTRLAVPFACHSGLMDPILEAVAEAAQAMTIRSGNIAMISSLSGALTSDEFATAAYWEKQMRQPVDFRGALATLKQLHDENLTVVEIGCGSTLLGLCKLQQAANWQAFLPSQRSAQDGFAKLQEMLGDLYERGHHVDWRGLADGGTVKRTRIPTYVFDRQRYWAETASGSGAQQSCTAEDDVRQDVLGAGYRAAANPPEALDLNQLAPRYEMALKFSAVSLHRAFSQLGAFSRKRMTKGELTDAMAIQDSFKGLLSNWLTLLVDDGVLKKVDDETYEPIVPFDVEKTDKVFQEAVGKLDLSDGYLRYLASCGSDLADVITGRKPALETLFPGGSFEIVDHLYRQSPEAQYFNKIAAKIVARWARSQSGAIRVLEIGAGTGGMTGALLSHLPAERTCYCFTDLSEFFFAMARRRFRDFDFLRYGTFNVDTNQGNLQGLDHPFDLIVASNVLHATPHLRRTIQSVKSRLRPGGILLMNEVTTNQPWFDTTVALIEGWRIFDDGIRTEGGPLVSEDVWRGLLTQEGFEHATAFPARSDKAEMMGQHIIVAFQSDHDGGGTAPGATNAEVAERSVAKPRELTIDIGLMSAFENAGQAEKMDVIAAYLASMLPDWDRRDLDTGFFEMGLDSLMAVDIRARLSTELDVTLPTTALFDYPTPRKLIGYILECLGARSSAAAMPPVALAPEENDVELSDSDLVAALESALAATEEDV